MRLRSDAIGHIEKPTEKDIHSAISYPNAENYLVKLMIDDQNFLCVWIGNKEIGHTLELKTNSGKLTCKKKFETESAIQVMIKYLNGDMRWLSDYSWDKSISQKFLENLELLVRQSSSK